MHKAEATKHWLVNVLTEPLDHAFLATPAAFPAASPVLVDWVAGLEELVKSGKKPKYLAAMQLLHSCIKQHGLELAIRPVDTCSCVRRSNGGNKQLWLTSPSGPQSPPTHRGRRPPATGADLHPGTLVAAAMIAFWVSGRAGGQQRLGSGGIGLLRSPCFVFWVC